MKGNKSVGSLIGNVSVSSLNGNVSVDSLKGNGSVAMLMTIELCCSCDREDGPDDVERECMAVAVQGRG